MRTTLLHARVNAPLGSTHQCSRAARWKCAFLVQRGTGATAEIVTSFLSLARLASLRTALGCLLAPPVPRLQGGTQAPLAQRCAPCAQQAVSVQTPHLLPRRALLGPTQRRAQLCAPLAPTGSTRTPPAPPSALCAKRGATATLQAKALHPLTVQTAHLLTRAPPSAASACPGGLASHSRRRPPLGQFALQAPTTMASIALHALQA